MRYAELHCKTNFSFLRGASHPDELVSRASQLGYAGLAVTDQTSLAGVVRAWGAAKDLDFKLLVGTEIAPQSAPPLVLWATNRAAYGRMCRLISRGRLRCEKGQAQLYWDDLVELSEGLLCGVIVPEQGEWADHQVLQRGLQQVGELFGDRVYLLCELTQGVDDQGKLAQLRALEAATGVPLVAAGDVHYHLPERMLLHDCLTAIRSGQTIDQVHAARFANAQRHLRGLPEIAAIYRKSPELIERTAEVLDRCDFRLDSLRYEYPEELAPAGKTPLEHLKRLTWEGAKARWPGGVPDKIIDGLRHELALISELRYEAYFLTVWDLVRFARERNILCQGRGSAANSMVCYCLGITSVDPGRMNLLFERFISRERDEAPDIDVDFEHQRREEVLQYIYAKYGRERAGMTAVVISYRSKSAVRDIGKALGAAADTIDRFAKVAGSRGGYSEWHERIAAAGLDATSELGRRWVYLLEQLIGFPRHLSQHVGGMVITAGPLCELSPIENAAMADRTVIQWNKDDLEELGILKVDCLSLGMLSALRRCFELVEKHSGQRWSLATLPPGDPATYAMIQRADTMGVFQIESRAQMSMLPRLKPTCFYDLVIEVAIVRPGPIQGQMVHPYLKARENPEAVVYPTPEIRQVLVKTLGVPLFQEQAMRLAVVAAGFTPGEADQLRRAMAAWRRPGVIDQLRLKLMEGMRERGLSELFAEQVYRQIRSFGEYGFPESHAASFALLVYASCYLKCHYPAAFCAALLNSQPMGFYAPAQLVADAQEHGVRVLPVDVNHSQWDCTLEAASDDQLALRLGLRMIRGLPQRMADCLLAAREAAGPFTSIEEMTRRTKIGQAVLALLADADALASVTMNRRAALWDTLGQEKSGQELPLLAAVDPLLPEDDWQQLEPLTSLEEVYADYNTVGLSLKGHPLQFCREELAALRCVVASKLPELRSGRHVTVAGLVLMRQRPGTAKGITFVTIEDETGSMNLILYPAVWKRFLTIAQTSNAWLVDGKLESQNGVIHVLASQVRDLTSHVSGLDLRSRDFH